MAFQKAQIPYGHLTTYNINNNGVNRPNRKQSVVGGYCFELVLNCGFWSQNLQKLQTLLVSWNKNLLTLKLKGEQNYNFELKAGVLLLMHRILLSR